LGCIVGSLWGPEQRTIELRKRIEDKISETKKKMINNIGPLQSNILLLQIDSYYTTTENIEYNVFRGVDGLFQTNQFPWLSGVIILKSGIDLPDHDIEGSLFINPLNKEIVEKHPILFSKIINK